MSKQHRILTILLVLVLCISLMMSLIACTTLEEEKKEATDSGKIISNGNFELTTGTNFPMTPSNWTGVAGSTAVDNETPTDEKSLSKGIVSVNATDYDKNKKKWGKLDNPGKVGEDDNILMINNKVKNSYKYSSSSFSLKSNKYYKMSAYVRTDKLDVDADGGAFMGLTGDTYKFFKLPDTHGSWQEVQYFFKTSNISSNSVSMWVSLGSKGLSDGMLAKGYAFFDNIVIDEMKDINGLTPEAQYNAVVESTDSAIFKSDMTITDANFENISGSKAPYTPSLWSGAAGSGPDGSAPTGNDYLEKGIIDLTNPNEFIPVDSLASNGPDNFVLGINNKQRTAYGYRTDKRIRFEANKFYALSIDIATFIDNLDNPSDSGVFLRLKSGTGADEVTVEIEKLNTGGAWKTATFYVDADDMRNKDYYLELFLGKGGKDDALLIKGKAFFDNIQLKTITETEYNNAADDKVNPYNKKISINTPHDDNLIEDANGNNGYFVRDELAYKDLNKVNQGNDIVSTALKEEGWNTAKYGAYPGKPNDSLNNVIILKNDVPGVNIYRFKDLKTISPNSYYRMGIWVKTADIPKTLGLNVALYSYDNNGSPTATESEKTTKLISFDNINTDQIKNNLNGGYDDYVELVFYIEGDLLSEYSSKDKDVFVQVSLGSGNNFESAKHARGIAYMTGFTMYQVNYTDYSTETGDYLKKHSFKENSYGVSNGGFDDINLQATGKLYGADKLTYDTNGSLNSHFGIPSSWTYSDESYLKKQINAGIINVNTLNVNGISNPLLDMLNKAGSPTITFDDAFYKGFEREFGVGKGQLTAKTNPNLLVISTKTGTDGNSLTESVRPKVCGCPCEACIKNGYCDGSKCLEGCACAHHNFNGNVKPWGFTSPSMSLTANSYYKLSVWANVIEGTATISLKSSTKETPQRIVVESTVDGWQRFDFYVETGFENLSVNMELFLGDMTKPDIASYNGTTFFDMPSMAKVDKDTYDAAKKQSDGDIEGLKAVSYSKITFDNVTKNEGTLDTPTGWTGSHRDDEAPNEEKDTISGVYNINHGNSDWFGKDDKYTIDINTLNKIYLEDNENILVINNTLATEYVYNYSLSKSLTSKSYYRISIDVLTYRLAQDQNANISLKLENNTYEFAKNDENGVKVNTSTYATDGSETVGWKTYYFYVSTPEKNDIGNVKLSVGLGNSDKKNYVAGFAFFDNLNIQKIDSDEFPEETKPEGSTDDMYNKAISHRIVFTDADMNNPEPPAEKESNFLWLYITTGIIGGLVLLAVIVVLYKKVIKKHIRVRGKSNKNAKPATYSKNTTPDNSKKSGNKPSDSFKDKK